MTTGSRKDRRWLIILPVASWVIFGLLSAHALTAWAAMGRIADLQAALDMKRMALDMKRGQKMRLAAGDDVDLFGHALVRFHNSAEIEIIR